MRDPGTDSDADRDADRAVTAGPETPAGGTLEVTDATFRAAVLEAEMPVLVDFWAPWCAPCRLVAPVVAELGREMVDRLAVAKVDIDENVAVSTEYQVFSIPTLILFKAGREVDRVIGFKRKDDLAARISRHLG